MFALRLPFALRIFSQSQSNKRDFIRYHTERLSMFPMFCFHLLNGCHNKSAKAIKWQTKGQMFARNIESKECSRETIVRAVWHCICKSRKKWGRIRIKLNTHHTDSDAIIPILWSNTSERTNERNAHGWLVTEGYAGAHRKIKHSIRLNIILSENRSK